MEQLLAELTNMIEFAIQSKMTGNVTIKVNLFEGGIANYTKHYEESKKLETKESDTVKQNDFTGFKVV